MNLEFSNLYSIYMLIFGLVVGSFLNVIIIRLPKTLKVIWANSNKYTDLTSDNFSIYKNMLWKGRSKCCLLYTSPSPRDRTRSRMPSSA